MDPKGMAFPALVLAAAVVGLWWHFSRARKGPISRQDKLMAGTWAAITIIAAARVVVLLLPPDAPTPQ